MRGRHLVYFVNSINSCFVTFFKFFEKTLSEMRGRHLLHFVNSINSCFVTFLKFFEKKKTLSEMRGRHLLHFVNSVNSCFVTFFKFFENKPFLKCEVDISIVQYNSSHACKNAFVGFRQKKRKKLN